MQRQVKYMAKILVAEDNPDYCELLQNFLESAAYQVTAVNDGAKALDLMKQQDFDLILLDIMLPKIDGFGVCEMIRKTSDIPIIMLTALESETHQLHGYALEIDDYITKPVSMPLLLHKVEAVLRRTMSVGPEELRYKDIALDLKEHTVSVGGEIVYFTLREFEILQELMQSPGEVITRKSLITKLWGYDFYDDSRIVDTHMKNIRKKLGIYDYIETIRGIGYKLRKEEP